MFTVAGIGFAQPWLFIGLFALPILFWLARYRPPPPRVIAFPATRLLFGLSSDVTQTKYTPLWLLILRVITVGLIITALTRPVINPDRTLDDTQMVVVVVDNGWSAAERWEARATTIRAILQTASRENLPTVVIPTAAPIDGGGVTAFGPAPAGDVMSQIATLEPMPWDTDTKAALATLDSLEIPAKTRVYWLPDSVTPHAESDLVDAMVQLGDLTVFNDIMGSILINLPTASDTGLNVRVQRTRTDVDRQITIVLNGKAGEFIAQQEINFTIGNDEKIVTFDLPVKLRNDVRGISIRGQRAIGSTIILNENWQRKSVGILSRDQNMAERPLFMGQYYVSRALRPHADITVNSLAALIDGDVDVLIEATGSRFQPSEVRALSTWIEDGGVLVRFAGPRLAADQQQDLLPIRLRDGHRTLGSTLAWDKPLPVAAFDDDSIFAGIKVPNDVRIRQQVLAQSNLDAASLTWASLEDGTPLLTGRRSGAGWMVLFHVSANAEWSDLPLSGAFPSMLRRIIALAGGGASRHRPPALYPVQSMNGFGVLQAPSPMVQPLNVDHMAGISASPLTPPGIYGTENRHHVFNLADLNPILVYDDLNFKAREVKTYGGVFEQDLMGVLLFCVLVLLVGEALALVWIGRSFRRGASNPSRFNAAALVAAALTTTATLWLNFTPQLSRADVIWHADTMSIQDKVQAAASGTHLAYVLTGDAALDTNSLMGLRGLSEVLKRRTAIEPLPPIGVDLNMDELQVWPLLYWPVSDTQIRLTEDVITRLNRYLRTGGTILFDTQDELLRQATGVRMVDTPNGRRLAEILDRLDVPPLLPVSADHVLSRTFYLLQEFPGRYSGGYVWIEQRDGASYDGVSGLVIGTHDWAAAWAMDHMQRYPYAVTPGGEDQREMAYRFGVNLVMYVLTGNYKSDQVHMPAILERLGH